MAHRRRSRSCTESSNAVAPKGSNEFYEWSNNHVSCTGSRRYGCCLGRTTTVTSRYNMGMFVVATTLLLLVLCGGCEGFLMTNDPNRQITRSILTNVFSPRRIERATFHFQTSSSSSSRSRCHANSHSREFQRLGSSISSTSGTDISTSTSLVDLCWAEFSEGGETHTYRAPPVLLLHGLLGSKRNFASLGTSLAAQLQQKRRIYAVDLRNHGTYPITLQYHK
jgi:hypothetical protein